eukprot:37338_1
MTQRKAMLMKITRMHQSSIKMENYKHKYGIPNITPSLLIQNNHMDTSIWDEFNIQDTDIFINTPWKAGTTWMQEIVSQLLYNGNIQNVLNVKSIHAISKWFTLHAVPREIMVKLYEDQLTNPNIIRRVIKTHDPVESIPFHKNVKYIFVGRDFRDIVWSQHSFHSQYTDAFYDTINTNAERLNVRPFPKYNYSDGSFTQLDLYNVMLNEPDNNGHFDGYPCYSQLSLTGSWWNIKQLPNVKMIHYNDLKRNLSEQMRDVARFLDINIDENNFDNLVANCSFEKMKRDKLCPIPPAFFKDEQMFFNSGQIGQWKQVLNDTDIENYRNVARRYLNEDGIYWLENGNL